MKRDTPFISLIKRDRQQLRGKLHNVTGTLSLRIWGPLAISNSASRTDVLVNQCCNLHSAVRLITAKTLPTNTCSPRFFPQTHIFSISFRTLTSLLFSSSNYLQVSHKEFHYNKRHHHPIEPHTIP